MYSKGIELAPEDYRLWGGRADSRWSMPQGRDAAREDYRRAIALAEKSLEVDATDAEAWAQLGYYYGRLGDVERANRYVARGMELGPDAPFVFYCRRDRRGGPRRSAGGAAPDQRGDRQGVLAGAGPAGSRTAGHPDRLNRSPDDERERC